VDLDLTGKVALVTGGSRGIGAAIVRALAAEGCRTALTHVGDAEAAAAVGGLAFDSDASDPEAVEDVVGRVVAELGGLDILVCNAGITADAVIWKMSDEQWDRVLDVNLKGCFHYCRAAAPLFRERKGGRIVNITSINGLRGKFGQTNYAASKGGMIAFTKSLARELGRSGVTVNAVAPGMVATEMIQSVPAEFREAAEKESLLNRIADPADVADAVVFLCSARARHITGEVIRVDGGQYL
jgi:3-oxoacyl-[acyl-carrier protein] reductase